MYQEPKHITSSYAKNNVGETIYNIVRKLKPERVVEFGSLYGYSTICIAQALRDNGYGHLFSYDLYEKYEYNSADLDVLRSNINFYDLDEWVTLDYGDFFDFCDGTTSFDLAHIDVSNTGDTVQRLHSAYPLSSVIFEGGSVERDQCEWMVKYKSKPINSVKNQTGYRVLDSAYPSLSGFNVDY